MSAPEVTVIEDIRPLIALVAPLIGLIGIVWAGEKRRNLRETFTFLAAIVQASAVLSMVPLLLGGGIIEFHIWQIFTNVPLLLRVDGFGLLFACVASLLWIATTVYAIGYMRGLHEHAQTRFYSFFAISLSATMGVAFSANLLTIYFFYEMLSVSTFPLVTHAGQGGSNRWPDLSWVFTFYLSLPAPSRLELVLCMARRWNCNNGLSC